MIRTSTVLFLAVLLLAGCDANNAQQEFAIAAGAVPSGIFRTDDGVTALNGENDPDDWRTAPIYATSGFRVSLKAFPNPASISQSDIVTLEISTSDRIPGGLQLVAIDGLGRRFALSAFEPIPGNGFYVYTFFVNELPGAAAGQLWRLILFDNRGEPVTYGDLLIEQ